MAKTDTKVKTIGLNKISPLFGRPWNGLASSGTSTKWNHACNFEPKTQYLQSKNLQIWHLKGSGQDLKSTLKLNSPVTYLCSLFCTLTCTSIVSKAWRWPVLHDFATNYIIFVSTIRKPLICNTHLTDYWYVYAIGTENTKWLSNTPPPPPRSKIDHTKKTITHPQGPPQLT